MKIRGRAVFWGLVLAACGDSPTGDLITSPFEDPPRWVNRTGLFRANNVDGLQLPVVLGSEACPSGDSTRTVTLTSAEIQLMGTNPDPEVWDPARALYLVSLSECDGITETNSHHPEGTHRVREDSVFFNFRSSGGWSTGNAAWIKDGRNTTLTQFRVTIVHRGRELSVLFE